MGKPGELYQPSNGTEGCFFEDKFCSQCKNEKFMHTAKDGDKICDIYSNTMIYDTKDPEYPKEWTFDADGQPTCTAYVFKKWELDDNGDEINPETDYGYNPNQLTFFK